MSGGRRSVNPTIISPGNFGGLATSPTPTTNVVPTPMGAPTPTPILLGSGGGRVRNSSTSGNTAGSSVGLSASTAPPAMSGTAGVVANAPTTTIVTATAPSVQLVSTQHTKILKANKDQKFTHSDVEEVYNSFRSLRFSDANLDFVKFVDTQIHKLIDFEFRHLPNKGDWRYLTAEDFFGHLKPILGANGT